MQYSILYKLWVYFFGVASQIGFSISLCNYTWRHTGIARDSKKDYKAKDNTCYAK